MLCSREKTCLQSYVYVRTQLVSQLVFTNTVCAAPTPTGTWRREASSCLCADHTSLLYQINGRVVPYVAQGSHQTRQRRCCLRLPVTLLHTNYYNMHQLMLVSAQEVTKGIHEQSTYVCYVCYNDFFCLRLLVVTSTRLVQNFRCFHQVCPAYVSYNKT